MQLTTFHCSRVGAAHVRFGLPCQDYSANGEYHGWHMAVVADGHGSRRHFRSQTGARIACDVALEALRGMIDDGELQVTTDETMIQLKRHICDAWREAVLADYGQNPWTEAELTEISPLLKPEQMGRLLRGEDAPVAYGTTVCAAWAGEAGWGAVQLGDGSVVHISREGGYDWPMPPSLVNQGNKTASLCMSDPMWDFRHCWGSDNPAGLLLCTDGIDKTFPPQSPGIISFMHWVWNNERVGEPDSQENLEGTLDMFTGRSASGDDVSVAGIVDRDAPEAQPHSDEAQRLMLLNRLRARITEIDSTVEFNVKRLSHVDATGDGDDLAAELRRIIDEKRAEAQVLRREEATLAAALDLPCMPETREEQPALVPDTEAAQDGMIEPPLLDLDEKEETPLESMEQENNNGRTGVAVDGSVENDLLEVRTRAGRRKSDMRLLRRETDTPKDSQRRRRCVEKALRSLWPGRRSDK